MATRKEQKELRREQILITALKLFVKKGFSGTKVADIAAEAGMSAGLLFHYFPSKEALLEELVKVGLGGTKTAMQYDPGDPIHFFRQAAEGILQYTRQNPQIVNMFVLMERVQQDEAVPPHIRELACKVDNIEASVPLIEAGQRMGQIREGAPLALSNTFWMSLHSVIVSIGLCGAAENENCQLWPEPEWFVDILKNQSNGKE
ncbi:MAG: TetR/AcrR family transcriptional regulator [Eubacteriales bacterium]|nr:TetR/AcrR family transcriptional regulator [Eubacteriales bacterium]